MGPVRNQAGPGNQNCFSRFPLSPDYSERFLFVMETLILIKLVHICL